VKREIWETRPQFRDLAMTHRITLHRMLVITTIHILAWRIESIRSRPPMYE